MRTYEIMFVLKPDLSEEIITETKDRLLNILSEFNGELINQADNWGKRRLAYSIDDYMEGLYCLWYFKGLPETVKELDRVIKLSDKFLRHIIIRHDE